MSLSKNVILLSFIALRVTNISFADTAGCDASKVTIADFQARKAAIRIEFKKSTTLPANAQGKFGVALGSGAKMRCGIASDSQSAMEVSEGTMAQLNASQTGNTDPQMKESHDYPYVYSMIFSVKGQNIGAGCMMKEKIDSKSKIADALIRGLTNSGLLTAKIVCTENASVDPAFNGGQVPAAEKAD